MELSVQRLKPIIEREKARLVLCSRVAAHLEALLTDQRRLLKEVAGELGDSDPVAAALQGAVTGLEKAHSAFLRAIEQGREIAGK